MSREDQMGPPGWLIFVNGSELIKANGPYCKKGRTWSGDYRALQDDVAAGVDEAIKIHAAFIKYRLTQ
jgi:hypothetical protein